MGTVSAPPHSSELNTSELNNTHRGKGNEKGFTALSASHLAGNFCVHIG